MIKGESGSVLKEKNSIVLSRSTAARYFGPKNPVGELLLLNGKESLTVTGVFQDLQDNTHLDFDFVISNRSKENQWNDALWGNTHCYAKFTTEDFKELENRVNAKLPEYWAEIFRLSPHVRAKLILQPLQEVPFSEDYIQSIFRVLAIGIACLGLLGMLTNKVDEKKKEIGIRKSLGAGMGSKASSCSELPCVS